MPRDHFSKMFSSPYFQSDFYKNESVGGRMEKRIEKFVKKILRRKEGK